MISNKPIFISHRGESFDAPENTISAVKLAWERNSDAVEIDIQLSKDNEIVVIHDKNTKRTSGINKKVKFLTLSELKQLDVGNYKNIKWKSEKIPTLKEVFQTIPHKKKIIIEIKSDNKIIKHLKKVILESNLARDQIEIIGFNLNTISELKKELPKYKILWLIEFKNNFILRVFEPSLHKVIKLVTDNNIDGIDMSFSKKHFKKYIDKIKSLGLIVYAWTINDPDIAKKLIDANIDGITTDKAKWLKEKIHKLD